MAVCINVISILMDVVVLSMNWPEKSSWGAKSRFGTVCAVSNLLLRPISSIILYRLFQDRAGTYGNFVMPSGLDSLFGNRRAPYEDIDQRGSPVDK
ncbi:hypothetical protein Anas_04730 [Armadillidium nasatum]|uniref:Uncharacterized protein n=1 Tax=Armadillidium nasatum TaxID=96803 RepID=A0A5N5T056_9CRUS|nr:hypothetical protein Anas_04730 [Armadillidium nasatum]